jgi:hydrogenase maturation factor
MCLGTAGVVTSLRDDDGVPMATVDTGAGQIVTASLLTCPEAVMGDTVLIHSGYVLRVLDAEQIFDGEPAFGARNAFGTGPAFEAEEDSP